MSGDVEIEQFLRAEGFTAPAAAARARAVLEEEGLTRPGKQRIAGAKLPQARQLFARRLLKICQRNDCAEAGAALAAERGRELVPVATAACELCGGSSQRRATQELADELRRRGLTQLAIVGGTPTQHAELRELLAKDGLALRCVDATKGSHSGKEAAALVKWADVVVIWAPTPLPHKVSNLYKEAALTAGRRLVTVHQRGIEALCRAVLRHVRGAG